MAKELPVTVLLAAAALAAPLVIVRVPPMVDFPAHEAIVGVLRHWGDRSYVRDGLYVLNWGHPNQLQYALAWPLSYLFGPTRALEVVVAIAVASVVLGAARLAAHLGRPAWTGLLAAPVALGWNLHWGHIANLLGLGALLAVLPVLDEFARTPRWRGLPGVLAALTLLYFAHESALMIAVVAVGVFALAHGGGVREHALRALPCVVAVLAMFLQLKVQHLSLLNESASLAPVSLATRLRSMPTTLVGFYRDAPGPWFAAALLAVAMLNAARGIWRRARLPGRFVAVGALLFGAYLVLPASYNGVFFFFHRFLPDAWCLLVVATAPPAGTAHERPLHALTLAVPAAMLVYVLPAFVACDAAYRSLDAALPAIERASTVYSADLDRTWLHAFEDDGVPTRAAQGHVVAVRGGRSVADYTQSPIAPARMITDPAWSALAAASFFDPSAFDPERTFAQVRYVVLHVTYVERASRAEQALAPYARVVARAPGWLVLESTILTRT